MVGASLLSAVSSSEPRRGRSGTRPPARGRKGRGQTAWEGGREGTFPAARAALIRLARRETGADWLILIAGLLLAISLFLAWSHQFSPAVLARYGSSSALVGIPRDPTAWQVYSAADVLLALLAITLVVVALRGGSVSRRVLVIALAVALAFTAHASSVPPTEGASLYDAARGAYVDTGARAATGETVALVALSLGMAGTLLSLLGEWLRRARSAR